MLNLCWKFPSANALFVFEAAARCGNFTRAAQELYVSQPTVSRMFARMKDHLGVRLFERVRGGIELTESGKILYRKISEGFSGIESAIREIEALATGVETVTLSVSTGFTTHWLMPRMSRLHQAFPSVDLRFQLISGRIGGPLVDVDLSMRFLHDEEIDEHAVLVMPEMLLPLCNVRYHDHTQIDARRAQGDTVILMGDEAMRSVSSRLSASCARGVRDARLRAGGGASLSAAGEGSGGMSEGGANSSDDCGMSTVFFAAALRLFWRGAAGCGGAGSFEASSTASVRASMCGSMAGSSRASSIGSFDASAFARVLALLAPTALVATIALALRLFCFDDVPALFGDGSRFSLTHLRAHDRR